MRDKTHLMKTIFVSKLLPSPVGGDELFRVRAEAEDLLDGDWVDHRERLPDFLISWLPILIWKKYILTFKNIITAT